MEKKVPKRNKSTEKNLKYGKEKKVQKIYKSTKRN